jgi:hypothetical protein
VSPHRRAGRTKIPPRSSGTDSSRPGVIGLGAPVSKVLAGLIGCASFEGSRELLAEGDSEEARKILELRGAADPPGRR